MRTLIFLAFFAFCICAGAQPNSLRDPGFLSLIGRQPAGGGGGGGWTTNAWVTNWLARIDATAGSTNRPSSNTTWAVSQFCDELSTQGLLGKMHVVAVFTDNLACSTNPVITNGLGGPYGAFTNVGFVASDLTANGLVGNGTSKHLRTGQIPSQLYSSSTNAGVTIYVYDGNDGSTEDAGVVASASSVMSCYVSYSGTTYWDTWNQTAGQGRISAANSAWAGYISFVRYYGGSAVYRANSATNHQTLVSGTGSGGTVPSTMPLPIYCENHYSLGHRMFTTRRYSFVAFHDSLNATESSAFYNAIQTLRQRLGGGYR